MAARALVTSYSFDAASDSRAVTVPGGCEVLELSIASVAAGVDQSSVTVGGQAMTKDGGGVHSGGKPRVNVWRRISPPTGSQTVVITMSGGAADKTAVAVNSWTGINGTTPFDGFVSANGLSTTPASASVTSAVGDLVADAMGSLSAGAYSSTGGQTEIFDVDAVSSGRLVGGHEAGAASVATSWSSDTADSKEWVVVAWNANDSGAGPSPVVYPRTRLQAVHRAATH